MICEVRQLKQRKPAGFFPDGPFAKRMWFHTPQLYYAHPICQTWEGIYLRLELAPDIAPTTQGCPVCSNAAERGVIYLKIAHRANTAFLAGWSTGQEP